MSETNDTHRDAGEPATLADLEHALKRHRLLFLWYASGYRWRADGRGYENVARAETCDPGWWWPDGGASDGIFKYEEDLDEYGEAAFEKFGPGQGKPNVYDEGDVQYYPQWQVDKSGVECLEQSADEVTRLVVEVLSKHSPDWASREAIDQCRYLARPGFPKWSAHRPLPWKYLEELDGGILAVRESALGEQARRGTLPDRTFLKKIADETHRLIVSGDTERNAARAREQLHAAVELEDRYQEAGREWWRIWTKYLTKYEAGPRLGDKGAGPPAEGWVWVDNLATPMKAEPKGIRRNRPVPGLSLLIGLAVEPCGGWLPPPLLTPPELPPRPMPGHDSEKDTPDVILARAYLTLAVVHDNVDCVERRNRAQLLQGVNLHRPWVAATALGHRSMQHTHKKGFDRESIEQALQAVKADLHTLAGLKADALESYLNAGRAELAEGETPSEVAGSVFCVRDGRLTVTFQDKTEPTANRMGYRYMALLLQEPEKSFTGQQLEEAVHGSMNPRETTFPDLDKEEEKRREKRSDGYHVLDRTDYSGGELPPPIKNKLNTLQRDLDDTVNLDRRQELKDEIEGIERGYAKNLGARGRPRKDSGEFSKAHERVRKNIENANKVLKGVHPGFWQHIHASLKVEGMTFTYSPPESVDWQVDF